MKPGSDYYYRLGMAVRLFVGLFWLGLIVVTSMNLASGVEAASWPFYLFAGALTFAFWQIAGFFIRSSE